VVSTAALELLLRLSHVAETEAKTSTYMLRGIGLWSGKDSDAGHVLMLTRLMASDTVFQTISYAPLGPWSQ
jgi:hypothetical protein